MGWLHIRGHESQFWNLKNTYIPILCKQVGSQQRIQSNMKTIQKICIRERMKKQIILDLENKNSFLFSNYVEF